jgi:uncharacterized protein YbcI
MASQNEDATASSDDSAQRALTADISEAMVRLYKDLFGRGPTRAKTEYAGADTVICSLWDTLTLGERSLLEIGQHDRARETRILFQYARSADFIDIIQGRTGRKVVGFVSGMDVENDVAAEVFYLEPRPGDNGNRAEASTA